MQSIQGIVMITFSGKMSYDVFMVAARPLEPCANLEINLVNQYKGMLLKFCLSPVLSMVQLLRLSEMLQVLVFYQNCCELYFFPSVFFHTLPSMIY